jgi:hypothetical protein
MTEIRTEGADVGVAVARVAVACGTGYGRINFGAGSAFSRYRESDTASRCSRLAHARARWTSRQAVATHSSVATAAARHNPKRFRAQDHRHSLSMNVVASELVAAGILHQVDGQELKEIS